MDATSARSLSLFPTAAALVNATEERTKFQSFARKKATEAGFNTLASILDEFGLGSSPSIFLHAMKLTSTIISGSIALAVLHPGMFRHGDMDLYTTSTPHSHLLCDILLSFGYTALESVSLPQSIYSTKSIGCVRRYQMRSGSQHHFINVFHVNSIDQCHPTPISGVFEFISTLAMNYIAHYGIVCLYPRTTLARHGYWLYESADAQDWIDKYVERGFDLEAYNGTAGTGLGERNLYDDGVLFLPFEKDGKPKPYSVQLVEHNLRWRLL
ncbi:hypothetical protein D9613_012688 [Agrocybe pediades]|uniref:Uncharacterized protein n=1 Tax=Agrocybe pediades TaxID=84607 RepID=A0A8H4VPF4_9AGAR|nr:hypothetical protein D9613_012688 [Agrocybe pediades]